MITLPEFTKPLDTPLSKEELQVLGVMLGVGILPGNFFGSLIMTIMHADSTNTQKLGVVYPDLVKAAKSYQYGNLVERWQAQEQAHDQDSKRKD